MTSKNIIIFHAESWDGRMLGAMGHPALAEATPNADALAQRGVMFENTYCSHPICNPSRANMWSGKYTHNCESWNNFKGLESGMWAFPEAINQTHNVGFYGKKDYRSGKHTLLARLSAWLGPVNQNRPVFDEDDSQKFKVLDNWDRRCHKGDWEKIDNAIQFLENQQNQEKPFFLTLSSSLVHPKFTTNQYWLDRIPEELVDIPPEDNTDHPAVSYQRMAKAWRYGFDEETVRKVRQIYMAMCAEADALLGEIVDTVDKMGLKDDTIIIFLSDHGELALEHQDWYKMSMYEGSVRVPMIMAGPGLESGLRLSNIVSLIDVCPTLIELTDITAPSSLDGESLVPLITGETTESRDTAYAMFSGCTMNTTAFMLRKGPWKYMTYTGYESQLFNLEEDPEEINNLSKERSEVVKDMEQELDKIVDREDTHQRWMEYNKQAFAEFRRQAKQGLYVDGSYALSENPSSDYWEIMNNAFTGWNEEDENRLERWLND